MCHTNICLVGIEPVTHSGVVDCSATTPNVCYGSLHGLICLWALTSTNERQQTDFILFAFVNTVRVLWEIDEYVAL